MKSRLLLISTILAATAGLGVSTAQAGQPDAQAQAAALLSSSHVAEFANIHNDANASSKSVGDAQAQAAALLSGTRAGDDQNASAQITSRAQRPSLDAQAQAAALLSGSRTTVNEVAQTSATAEKLGDHPAVVAARTWSQRGIDANTFIVAHPARLQLVAASPSENAEIQVAASAAVSGVAGR